MREEQRAEMAHMREEYARLWQQVAGKGNGGAGGGAGPGPAAAVLARIKVEPGVSPLAVEEPGPGQQAPEDRMGRTAKHTHYAYTLTHSHTYAPPLCVVQALRRATPSLAIASCYK